ncbi:MAG TPA: glycoside hydrolase family 95 protein [Polyangiaceae bacterium]
MTSLKLRYGCPALEAITEGLPLGNGWLGALLWGEPARERLVLNEGTLWAGGPYDGTSPEARGALAELRRLVFAGEYVAARALAEEKLMGRPKTQAEYTPLGELSLECPEHAGFSDYHRELDLDTALVTTRYRVGDLELRREAFVSAADQVLVLRLSVNRPGALHCRLRVSSEHRGVHDWQRGPECRYTRAELGMRGRNAPSSFNDGALRYEFAARLLPESGRVLPGEESVSVRGADRLVVIAAAATSYVNYRDLTGDPAAIVANRLAAASELSFDKLFARHLADYQPRFRRFQIALGGAREELPTDARVATYEQGNDPGLAALYVQYARYLMLSCSRPGGQPATLQGIWNHKLHPPWGSKYTININTEMNYWFVDSAALPECNEPLFTLLEDLAQSGRQTAERHYGARGWVAHHNVDLWRSTQPIDGADWGLWPMGGAWLSLQLWDHYCFSLDRAHLARAYPILKGAAEFFLDFLVEHPRTRELVTCPSVSPENMHPFGTTLCAAPTMDSAILRDLFAATAEAGEILERDAELVAKIRAARARLPEYRIGKAGQLQEWLDDWDLEAPERTHRHVSHLFGLHPSRQISPLDTPELAAAARRTLELRGDEATGWSLAWKVNFWARLLDGERAHALLELLLSPDRTYTNLFDAHPPFQIDGNFGGAAGILEMLVQSERGRLHLLPALPRAFRSGSIRGLRARGGLSLDLDWHDGELGTLRIMSLRDQEIVLRVKTGEPRRIALHAGVEFEVE